MSEEETEELTPLQTRQLLEVRDQMNKRAAEKHRSKGHTWTPEEVATFMEAMDEDPSPEYVKGFNNELLKRTIKDKVDSLVRAANNPAGELTIISESDVLNRPDPEWWIDGLLQKGTVAVLAGEAGIGKTFLSIHATRCVAAGMPFFGQAVSQGTALYVAAEGASAFGARVRAWDSYHHTHSVPKGAVNYVESGVNLMDPESVERLEGAIDQLQPDLIVLDTLSQLAGIDNENDNAQMAKVFRIAKQLRDHKEGATVILVHHVTKGSGSVRGASAARSNADTVIIARKAGEGFMLSTDATHDGKQKDGAPIKWDGFTLEGHLSSAVLTRSAKGELDPEFVALREIYADNTSHTKAELRVNAGFEKASGSDADYRRWERKFKKWVEHHILILVEDTKDTYTLGNLAQAPEPPMELPVWM